MSSGGFARATGRRLRWPVVVFAVLLAASARAQTSTERGAYLLRAGGCISCHTDAKSGGAPLAGGLALKTPFGVFYSPNITADPETGIGRWTDRQFLDALKHGVRPDGARYFPALPYTTYTKMTDADALAIKAHLLSLPPARRENRAHDLTFPFGWRWPLRFWQMLFFEDGEFRPDPARGEQWNRGAYLVEALAHCGECHTPRNALGGLERDRWLSGTRDGPEGEVAPNITPDPKTGIGGWSQADIVTLLKDGTTPEFDNVQGAMAEAVRDGLSHLSAADLEAIAVYLKAVSPIENKVGR